jgi:medium-chain acyl-[acyl-carrier-protein] hydrolase
LIDALRDYEGSPPEVLENNELMALLLPMIRADFAIADNYAYAPSLPLNIPISVLIGSSDRHSSDDTASEWAKESSKPCIAHYFDGGHFFIHSHRAQVLETICSELCQVTEHA